MAGVIDCDFRTNSAQLSFRVDSRTATRCEHQVGIRLEAVPGRGRAHELHPLVARGAEL